MALNEKNRLIHTILAPMQCFQTCFIKYYDTHAIVCLCKTETYNVV